VIPRQASGRWGRFHLLSPPWGKFILTAPVLAELFWFVLWDYAVWLWKGSPKKTTQKKKLMLECIYEMPKVL
jgi:hypothetical protein